MDQVQEVYIFDRRTSEVPEIKLDTKKITKYAELRKAIKNALKITADNFVISTTNREKIDGNEALELIETGDTLYILNDINQELCAPAQERVDYLPHYDTIVKGGMYEYYASEGQNPLPYAFAELIDNSLAATALNGGPRKIELKLYIDDSAISKNCIIVRDNGKGMTSRQLNNWAIYRLSKFTRRKHRGFDAKRDNDESSTANLKDADESINLGELQAPRFMNSDISYFGVGGKQAVFFIGNATRMISKPKDSKDVHELSISKDEFEQKERTNQSIYTGFIRNRQPGDASHLKPDDEHVAQLVKDEKDRENFTAVVIQGVNPEHLAFLKQHFHMWTRQLAHIYHFYLHGPDGNVKEKESPGALADIDIQVTLHIRGALTKAVNLQDIEDDMQTQYARTAASTFDFKAYVDGSTAVEGVIRYHPFKYDRETYPVDVYAVRVDPFAEDDHGYAINDRPARGRRPVFEAYWNGRLIPYTLIDEFEWCSLPKRQNIPVECYNRISGVIWTNDSFQVSTNKLTFLDLEMKLRDKNTNFVHVVQGNEKRTNIDKEFQAWLRNCNEEYDKQILFSNNKGVVTRPDQPKLKQTPWTKFECVEWASKSFHTGDMVRILRTTPALYGSIEAFYLYGEHEGNVYATGGDIELIQEPQSLYAERKFVSLNKLDRGASLQQIENYIEEEESKLPDRLLVSWPNGMEVKNKQNVIAGTIIGDLKVEICNKRGEKISKIPSSSGAKKLLVELKVIWHSAAKDETLVSLLSQHGKTWPYWFRKMECTKNLGSYTLQLKSVVNELGNTTFAGRELPSHTIKFNVTQAEAVKFSLGTFDGPLRVGVPFNIPLEFQDRFNNSTSPPSDIKPVLDADGLELSYENLQIKGQNCFIKGVMAVGTVNSTSGKSFNLKVSLPELDQHKIIKTRILPGPAVKLTVLPEGQQHVENGGCPTFTVQVTDVAGNMTSGGKLHVLARMTGASNLPQYSVDCSSTGTAVLTGKSINVKNMTGEKKLTALFDIQGVRNMKSVERTVIVTPSSRPSTIKVFYSDAGKQREITQGQSITQEVGTVIDTLSFEVLNEVGETVEIDERLANKVKVNWAPKVGNECALVQKLPPLKVLQSVTEPRYCQVSVMDGEGVELHFNVSGTAGPPAQMECVQGKLAGATVSKSEAHSCAITFKDKYGNITKPSISEIKKELKVSGPAVDAENIKIEAFNTTGVEIKGILFTGVGQQEVRVTWGQMELFFRCHVLSGPASSIKVTGWDPEQPVTVFRNKPALTPLVVSLQDDEGNPCLSRKVKVTLQHDRILKISNDFAFTGEDGSADFSLLAFNAPFGSYELQPRVQMGRSVVEGPKLTIVVQADPDKPGAIEVKYNNKTPVMAGRTTLDFTVSIKSETGEALTSAGSDCLSMHFASVTPDSVVKAGPGSYIFKKCQVPDVAGQYSVWFDYNDNVNKIKSDTLSISVKPGHPAVLAVKDKLVTPSVSNTRAPASRTIISTLELQLRDEFNNSTRDDYDGKVKVVIKSKSQGNDVPSLCTGKTAEFPLVKGQCKLQNILVQENTSGKDGEYSLVCTVQCDVIPKNKPLPPLEIPFFFYNDAKKIEQMSALTSERDTLRGTVQAYKSMFDVQQQLVAELKAGAAEAQKEEQTVRAELRKQNIPGNHLVSATTVEKLVEARTKEREKVLRTPRRSCGLTPVQAEPGVVGKLGHLAMVQPDDIARVLSWHMAADMDCVITHTTAKAKEVYNKTQGQQQVLPLDSIFRKNLPQWDKPLPLERFKPGWRAPGNPVYARNMLEFPKEEESCRVVFGMLLGDTLILDTLDHANIYRQELVKFTHCPTILTRTGDRIRSNGKFGGAMNKAPPVDKLRGAVFAQPLPLTYHAICTQIETLERFKSAMAVTASANEDLQELINQQKLPETTDRMKEMKDAESRLKEIEAKIGMMNTARAPNSRTRRSEGMTEPALKKPKLEPGTVTMTPGRILPRARGSVGSSGRTPQQVATTTNKNNSGNSITSSSITPQASHADGTPARTSRRIASMTPVVSDDGRKRLKKSL